MRYLPLKPQNDGEFLFQIQLQKESLVLSAVERKDLLKSGMGGECLSVIENDGIAFDHAKLLACAIEKMWSELDSAKLVFHLMPERFTLTELQQVYEVILGRLLLKAAFRRKMAPYVQETDQFADKAGHRPSRLYQRNRKDWYDVL